MLQVGVKRNVLRDNFVTVEEEIDHAKLPCKMPVPSNNAVDVGVDPTRKTYQP